MRPSHWSLWELDTALFQSTNWSGLEWQSQPHHRQNSQVQAWYAGKSISASSPWITDKYLQADCDARTHFPCLHCYYCLRSLPRNICRRVVICPGFHSSNKTYKRTSYSKMGQKWPFYSTSPMDSKFRLNRIWNQTISSLDPRQMWQTKTTIAFM